MSTANRNDEAVLRLINVLTALHAAGSNGLAADRLVAIAGWADAKDGSSALRRDLGKLSAMGWQIDNIAPEGSTARYRVVPGDNRLRVALTPGQQAALARAALLADRGFLVTKLGLAVDATPPAVEAATEADVEALSALLAANRMRCVIRFDYDAKSRVVHPGAVQLQNNAWYVRGIEVSTGSTTDADTVKSFKVERMVNLLVDEPGTAHDVAVPQRMELHPLAWQIDPPVSVVLRTSPGFVADVDRWLRAPESLAVSTDSTTGDVVDMTYVVTNRAAFRSRLYMLGERVTVLSRNEFYDELMAELADMAGI